MKTILWEYYLEVIENMNRLSLGGRLASLGEEGWEFTQAIRSPVQPTMTLLIFKRPLSMKAITKERTECQNV